MTTKRMIIIITHTGTLAGKMLAHHTNRSTFQADYALQSHIRERNIIAIKGKPNVLPFLIS